MDIVLVLVLIHCDRVVGTRHIYILHAVNVEVGNVG